MPHESTVDREKIEKHYGPIENARRPQVMSQSTMSKIPCIEDHECDEENNK